MLGKRVILTPKGFDVNLRVSRIAVLSAAGLGWVRAVRIPRDQVVGKLRSITQCVQKKVPSPPASETAAASFGTPTL